MRGFACLCVAVLLAPAGHGQSNAQLSNAEALSLYRRAVDLMGALPAAVPGLATAAAPPLESARQSLGALEASPQNAALAYRLLADVRSYLAVAEAVPKPFPFPDEARKQFAELRDDADRMDAHFRALLESRERQLRNPDRDNLSRYAEANRAVGQPRPEKSRVVFLGDSITDGWRLNEYFTGRDYLNRGISGQITGEMLGRMQADVIALHPKAVIVLAGTNDIARGVPIETIENNLTMIADLADAHHIKVLLASLLPISDYHKDRNPQYARSTQRPPATIAALNQWLRKFCTQRGFSYVDYYTAMADKNGFLPAELSDDGLHPNGQGYRLMAPVALEAIERALGEYTPDQTRLHRR
ncbi:MAG TPA: SGNH/GDSL hydrolase family protein [Bryobacteraceae bacterium]|nr:SGNH/GDSL hydrolase family protein [Bryobacteraceae bacterium]